MESFHGQEARYILTEVIFQFTEEVKALQIQVYLRRYVELLLQEVSKQTGQVKIHISLSNLISVNISFSANCEKQEGSNSCIFLVSNPSLLVL